MPNKPHSCLTCVRLCEEAKDKSLRLEKKVFALTIALTSALTLIGQKAVEEIVSIVRGVQDITDSTGGDSISEDGANNTAVSVGTTPRTAPFLHNQSTEAEEATKTADKGKSGVEGISDTPKAPKGLMDVVNGRIPSMGELVEMSVAPQVPIKTPRLADQSLDSDLISYLDPDMIDPNARFVTGSPFGGYDYGDDNSSMLPVPSTVALLGIVPLLGRRRQR